jgi:hypothetical protein
LYSAHNIFLQMVVHETDMTGLRHDSKPGDPTARTTEFRKLALE